MEERKQNDGQEMTMTDRNTLMRLARTSIEYL